MAHWVQHKSGQGEKWEVVAEATQVWSIKSRLYVGDLLLPKSEYVLCDPPTPPTRWLDVTAKCTPWPWNWPGEDDDGALYLSHDGHVVGRGYRLRKVRLWKRSEELPVEFPATQWAFVVEKEQP